MFIIGNILIGIANVLGMILGLVNILVFAYCVISWLNADPNNIIVRVVRECVEPMLQPIRRRVPPLGRFDTSVIVLIAISIFLQAALVGSLIQIAHRIS